MRLMDQPIHDGIAEGRIAHAFMPVLDRHLAREQRGATAGAIFDHFEQIAPLAIANRGEPPDIKDQQIDFPELGEDLAVRAIAPGDRELGQEAWQAQIAHDIAVTTRAVPERAGQPGLAGARRSRDEQHAVLRHPVPRGTLHVTIFTP